MPGQRLDTFLSQRGFNLQTCTDTDWKISNCELDQAHCTAIDVKSQTYPNRGPSEISLKQFGAFAWGECGHFDLRG